MFIFALEIYRHFEPSETFGTASHQVRNTITGKVDACADVFPRCFGCVCVFVRALNTQVDDLGLYACEQAVKQRWRLSTG